MRELAVAAPVTPPIASPGESARADQYRKYMRDYQRKHRTTARGRALMHASNLRALYRLSLEQYEDVYNRQQGKCAICLDQIAKSFDFSVEKIGRGPKRGQAHVDHDHACCPGKRSCGKCLRGLLCSRCNAGLGSFRDRRDLLMAAIKYLG